MTKKEPPKWTGREKKADDRPRKTRSRVKAPSGPTIINLRCLFHTRLVIGKHLTLTGTRYVFDPGEVKSVLAPDAERLLKMEKAQPPGCCGSQSNPPSIKYFEAA